VTSGISTLLALVLAGLTVALLRHVRPIGSDD
jgi:hypothetical protein